LGWERSDSAVSDLIFLLGTVGSYWEWLGIRRFFVGSYFYSQVFGNYFVMYMIARLYLYLNYFGILDCKSTRCSAKSDFVNPFFLVFRM
jgi:hypothetical protein